MIKQTFHRYIYLFITSFFYLTDKINLVRNKYNTKCTLGNWLQNIDIKNIFNWIYVDECVIVIYQVSEEHL